MSTTVVAYRTDLIGGRLLNLMHGWRLARRLDADFIHLWPLFTKWRQQSGYADPAAPLSQIFDLAEHALAHPELRLHSIDGMSIGETVDLAARRLRRLPAFPDDPSAYPFAPTAEDVRSHWPAAAFTGATPFLLAGETLEVVRGEATALVRTLPLSVALTNALQRLRQATDLAGAVTVNIRRGDVVSLIAGAADLPDEGVRKYADLFVSRYAPESAFDAAMATAPDRRALVFSDSRETAAAFAERHPGAIDGRALLDPICAGLTPLQADMMQILAMSETERLLGSGSNFTIASAYYGGRPCEDLRSRWTATTVLDTVGSVFADAPPRIAVAVLDAFDRYFSTQSSLTGEREALAALRA